MSDIIFRAAPRDAGAPRWLGVPDSSADRSLGLLFDRGISISTASTDGPSESTAAARCGCDEGGGGRAAARDGCDEGGGGAAAAGELGRDGSGGGVDTRGRGSGERDVEGALSEGAA